LYRVYINAVKPSQPINALFSPPSSVPATFAAKVFYVTNTALADLVASFWPPPNQVRGQGGDEKKLAARAASFCPSQTTL
jgi:hypothetical protein